MATKKPGRRPTSRDVAALAQVAQSTVSYVLSGQKNVSPELERRVRDAIKTLGYQPNAGARTLRTARTQVLALSLRMDEHLDPRETAPFIRELTIAARSRGYDIILSPFEAGPEELYRLATRSICDALILLDTEVDDPRLPIALDLQIPFVFMGRFKDQPEVYQVDIDTREAAHQLVGELADTGHQQIFAIGEVSGETDQFEYIREFYQGLSERARERDIQLQILDRPSNRWEGYLAVASKIEKALQNGENIGIITRGPAVCEWVLRHLEQIGAEVGRDVSLASYLPDSSATSFTRPITNVAADIPKICQRAVHLALSQLDENPPNQAENIHLIEPTRLQRRATTRIVI